MFLQKLIQFLYTWEVRLGVILSMSIQIILLLFGSRRKISKATWLKILVWYAYVPADAVAIFSLGLLAHNKEELCKNELNHQLHLLWIPLLILHLGGPDTITAYSLEDNKLWLRHLLNLVIQVGVALYAILISWNNHNPLTYLVIPIFASGAVKYGERTWALQSASFEEIHAYMWANIEFEAKGTYFSEVYKFLFTLSYFFVDELLPHNQYTIDQGHSILKKTSSNAFRLVEDELGLMYDLLYTKALMIYSGLGICLRCLYLISSVATLTSFVIMHKHMHNESTWPYPLSDVLITYFLMIGAVILEIYAAILVVLSDWTLIWLDKHKNNNTFAKFLFQKISTYRRVLFSEKRWSRSLKQYTIDPSPTALKRIKDCFLHHSPFSLLVPIRWQMKEFEFEIISDAGDDAEQMMKEEVFKVIKDWLVVGNRRPENITFCEFISESDLKGLWESTTTDMDGSDVFGTSLFTWYIATTHLLMKPGDNIEEPVGFRSHSHYKASSKHLSRYLMYLVYFHQNMLPPGNYKHLCSYILPRIRRELTESEIRLPHPEVAMEPLKKDWFDKGTAGERVLKQAAWLTNYFNEMRGGESNTIPASFSFNNKWEIISSVWAHMLVYAAASQNKWVEHAQHLRRGGEFLTHVAVLFAHASTSKIVLE